MSSTTLTEVISNHLHLQPHEAPTAQPQDTAQSDYPYDRYLPRPDPNLKLPPLEPFEHDEPGLRVPDARTNPLNELLGGAESIVDLTPSIGSEIKGLQLSTLTPSQLDQLAIYVARRGVVAFRSQDFSLLPFPKILAFGQHFGRLHVHPTSAHPAGVPELHLVYRDGTSTFNYEQGDRVSSVTWHSDVSYEVQPPGLTGLVMLEQPKTGGDTLYASQVRAYEMLSLEFRKRLEGLKAVHSGVEQAAHSRLGNRGGIVRREPVETEHPLVRTHPVTGQRALYVNPQFTRRIVGYKREESDHLLNFLYDHIAKGADFHVRIKWEPGTVALWDNRVTAHTALLDFKESGERRHAFRITPQAEKPFF